MLYSVGVLRLQSRLSYVIAAYVSIDVRGTAMGNRFAVKIGEIRLTSPQPISTEQREKAVREVRNSEDRGGMLHYTEDGLTVEYDFNR